MIIVNTRIWLVNDQFQFQFQFTNHWPIISLSMKYTWTTWFSMVGTLLSVVTEQSLNRQPLIIRARLVNHLRTVAKIFRTPTCSDNQLLTVVTADLEALCFLHKKAVLVFKVVWCHQGNKIPISCLAFGFNTGMIALKHLNLSFKVFKIVLT